MAGHTKILDIQGDHSLTFYTGDLPADEAVRLAEHEPNGYFWEGIATFLSPEIAAQLEFDSEAGMFSAVGELADLQVLQTTLEPLLTDGEAVSDVIRRAEAAGFAFDD